MVQAVGMNHGVMLFNNLGVLLFKIRVGDSLVWAVFEKNQIEPLRTIWLSYKPN